MALNTELMALGMPWPQAGAIGQDVATGLTATGTNQATAYALTASISVFSTTASGTGALLPPCVGRPDFAILNSGANALTVYPTGSTETINGTTSFSVTNAKQAIFMSRGGTGGWIAILSA